MNGMPVEVYRFARVGDHEVDEDDLVTVVDDALARFLIDPDVGLGGSDNTSTWSTSTVTWPASISRQ
ncbi:MAG TPA: hypothetical protein H9902_10385 [Candidatus Stackebrandtia faecavium]|nr:hypothetical protein [Candidatus Stackebrandtia faecavium]